MFSSCQLSSIADDGEKIGQKEFDFFKQKFSDYYSLQKALDDWSAINYVQLVKRSCAKLKPHEDGAENRVYERLYYTCIHYGQPRVSKTENPQRPQQRYNACGCECFFHYKWLNGQFFLFNFNKYHRNHPETKEHWQSHPQQRRVDSTEPTVIEDMFSLKIPFRYIKAKVIDLTGKNLSDNNLRNIEMKRREKNGSKVKPRVN
jgi:hypothetical protein